MDADFARLLVRWADQVRRSYADGATEDVITTRRLVQAAQGYAIFGSRKKAVEGVLTRFDRLTQESFMDLYEKLDASGQPATDNLGAAPTEETAKATNNSCPF